MERLRSRKVVLREGFSIVHFRDPQLFSVFLKDVHVVSLFVLGGSHIPMMLSMYLL